jgi:cell division protein FtsZ
MVEYHRHSDAPAAPQGPISTAIVGVGGAGSNVLDRITLDRTMEATLVCMHTDVRVLGHSMAPTKIQLGTELMRGVGAGGDPDLGREAALFSRDVIRQSLSGHQMIFICAGLGGGTGSGAAPVIAEIAKSTGALVLVVATMPFSFEGRRRVNQAEEALELLQKRADALILFENNRMGELILPKDGIQKAFSAADQLISQSLRAVSFMISTPGLVKLGLDDLTAALAASNGRCLFGFGEARGKERGAEALKRALKSPLIDQGRLLHQTKNLLVHVAGGENMTLVEVEGIMRQVGRNVPDHTQILFGVAVDAKLGDAVAVTLISSLGAEVLQNYSQLQAPARLEPTPGPRNEPVAKATAPSPAGRAAEPEETEDEGEFSPAVAKSSAAADTFDLFAAPTSAAATSATATVAAAAVPPAPATRPVFEAVTADPQAEAPIPDEIQIEDEETPPTTAYSAPQVVAPVAETGPISLPVAKPQPPPTVQAREKAVPSSPESISPRHDDEAAVSAAPQAASDAPVPVQRRGEGLLNAVLGAPASAAAVPPPSSAPQAAASEPDMFQAGDQERGRFKNTEPSLVEGEDLDVPTWMRLRKKLQR